MHAAIKSAVNTIIAQNNLQEPRGVEAIEEIFYWEVLKDLDLIRGTITRRNANPVPALTSDDKQAIKAIFSLKKTLLGTTWTQTTGKKKEVIAPGFQMILDKREEKLMVKPNHVKKPDPEP